MEITEKQRESKEKSKCKKKKHRKKQRRKMTEEPEKTRPSRPIRCDVWIVERMRYRPTDQPTDTASYRGALSHVKSLKENY